MGQGARWLGSPPTASQPRTSRGERKAFPSSPLTRTPTPGPRCRSPSLEETLAPWANGLVQGSSGAAHLRGSGPPCIRRSAGLRNITPSSHGPALPTARGGGEPSRVTLSKQPHPHRSRFPFQDDVPWLPKWKRGRKVSLRPTGRGGSGLGPQQRCIRPPAPSSWVGALPRALPVPRTREAYFFARWAPRCGSTAAGTCPPGTAFTSAQVSPKQKGASRAKNSLCQQVLCKQETQLLEAGTVSKISELRCKTRRPDRA